MTPVNAIDGDRRHSDLLPAPGKLDIVRRFLNTERRDDATGRAVDSLREVVEDEHRWHDVFDTVPMSTEDRLSELEGLRADLRILAGKQRDSDRLLNRWIDLTKINVRAEAADGDLQTRFVPGIVSATAQIVVIVLEAIQDGTWSRLKACPDCGWVFYDRTRSKTKVWCRMNSGADGRGCGSIAKTRRYRQKLKQSREDRASDS